MASVNDNDYKGNMKKVNSYDFDKLMENIYRLEDELRDVISKYSNNSVIYDLENAVGFDIIFKALNDDEWAEENIDVLRFYCNELQYLFNERRVNKKLKEEFKNDWAYIKRIFDRVNRPKIR